MKRIFWLLRRPVVFAAVIAGLAALRFGALGAAHVGDGDQLLMHAAALDGSFASRMAVLTRWLTDTAGGWCAPIAALPLSLWLAGARPQFVSVLHAALIVANFFTLAVLARRTFRDIRRSAAACAIALVAVELRFPHDALAGTSLVMPFIVEFGLLTLVAALAIRRRAAAAAWIAGTVACLLAGEAGLAFATAAAIAAWPRTTRPLRIVAIAAALVTAGAVAVVSVRARIAVRFPHPADVVDQLAAAVPALWRSSGHLPIGRVPALYHGERYVDDRFTLVPSIGLSGWVFVVGVGALAWVAFGRRRRRPARGVAPAAVLLVLPACLSLPVATFLRGVRFGDAREVVYVQYVGLALLAAAALGRAGSRTTRVLAPLAVMALALLAYGDARADAQVREHVLRADRFRGVLERAAAAGLFRLLPSGSTIAVDPRLPFARGFHGDLAGASLAIRRDGGPAFRIIAANGDASERGTWLLALHPESKLPVSLLHRNASGGYDRALGYTPFADVAAQRTGTFHGLLTRSTVLTDGIALDARRTCGPVAADSVFEPNVPALRYADGFWAQGPIGYAKPPAPGEYPKMFFGRDATMVLTATPCGRGTLLWNGVAESNAPGELIIVSEPGGHTDRIRTGPALTRFGLAYSVRAGEVIRVRLQSLAPPTDMDPVIFRYERDRPRDIRAVIEPIAVTETTR